MKYKQKAFIRVEYGVFFFDLRSQINDRWRIFGVDAMQNS